LNKVKSIILVVSVLGLFFGTLVYSELLEGKHITITKLGEIQTTILGQSFEYPDTPHIEISIIEFQPGAETSWHTHNTPLIGTVLEGELTVYYCFEDKESIVLDILGCDTLVTSRHFKKGDVLVEAIDVLHKGVNQGDILLKLHVTKLQN
jgi:hypothetical protein